MSTGDAIFNLVIFVCTSNPEVAKFCNVVSNNDRQVKKKNNMLKIVSTVDIHEKYC